MIVDNHIWLSRQTQRQSSWNVNWKIINDDHSIYNSNARTFTRTHSTHIMLTHATMTQTLREAPHTAGTQCQTRRHSSWKRELRKHQRRSTTASEIQMRDTHNVRSGRARIWCQHLHDNGPFSLIPKGSLDILNSLCVQRFPEACSILVHPMRCAQAAMIDQLSSHDDVADDVYRQATMRKFD